MDFPEIKTSGRISASPRARRLAQEHGIHLKNIEPSQPGVRIVEGDVLIALDSQVEPTHTRS
jgi:pyruvate/2-oxoglutarate dehydrogenase complex dihydrolipoamide acyltransferase (E2) component